MVGLVRNTAAYLLIGTTRRDGRSILPRSLQRLLAMLAGDTVRDENIRNSLQAAMVRDAVNYYQVISRLGDRSEAQAIWQEAPDKSLAVQVLPHIQPGAERKAMPTLATYVQQVSFNHPRLAPILEIAYQEGYPYLVARLGEKAHSLAQEKGLPMAPQRAVRIVLQATEALEYAHYRGLIHGALAPSDVYLNENNVPSLLGIGIDQLRRQLGVQGDLPRTPLTPPEVAEGQKPDARSDVYALAALLYLLLTARPPVPGRPVHLSGDNPAIVPALDAVLSKALAARPEDRYPDMATFGRELQVASRALAEPRQRPAAPPRPQRAPSVPRREPQPQQRADGFPEPLPMPEIDAGALDQALQMPEIVPIEAVVLPEVPSVPTINWEAFLAPVDVSSFANETASAAGKLPADSAVDPLDAAAAAVRARERAELQKAMAAAAATGASAVEQPRGSQPSSGRRRRIARS